MNSLNIITSGYLPNKINDQHLLNKNMKLFINYDKYFFLIMKNLEVKKKIQHVVNSFSLSVIETLLKMY